MGWKIKDVYVWLTTTDLRWVYEGEHGITHELLVMVSPNSMTVDGLIKFEGNTLVHKKFVLEDRIEKNLWLIDETDLEKAFTLAMNEGAKQE